MCGEDWSAMIMAIFSRAASIETKPCGVPRPYCRRDADRVIAGNIRVCSCCCTAPLTQGAEARARNPTMERLRTALGERSRARTSAMQPSLTLAPAAAVRTTQPAGACAKTLALSRSMASTAGPTPRSPAGRLVPYLEASWRLRWLGWATDSAPLSRRQGLDHRGPSAERRAPIASRQMGQVACDA